MSYAQLKMMYISLKNVSCDKAENKCFKKKVYYGALGSFTVSFSSGPSLLAWLGTHSSSCCSYAVATLINKDLVTNYPDFHHFQLMMPVSYGTSANEA